MNIQTRVTLYTTLLVALISAVLIGTIYLQASQAFFHHLQQLQETRMRVAHDLLDRLGQPLHLVDGKLCAGSKILNDDRDFVDEVASLMGGNASLFQGDQRIATNIRLPDGSRANGTRVPESVMNSGNNFRGEVNILGEPYVTAYDELLDPDGRGIGMLEVGAKKTSYAVALSTILLRSVTAAFFGVLIIGFMVYWALRKLTDALEAVSENNRLLLKSTGSGIFEVDVRGECLYINEAGAGFLGGEPDDFEGEEIHSLIHSASARTGAECALCRTFPRGESYQTDDELLFRLDGSAFPAEIQSSPLFKKNKSLGSVVVFTDITERKGHADRLQEKNQEIEAGRQALAKVHELKASFYTTVSSEIRTPMNGVMGIAGILLSSVVEPEQRKLTEAIYHSGESLLHLFDLMEDYALIESGTFVLEFGLFDLTECVEFVFAEHEQTACERNIDFAFHIDEGTPTTVRGDEVRLQQVLYVLIGQFIRSTRDEEVKISVHSIPLDSTCRQFSFAISRDGRNISPRELVEILRLSVHPLERPNSKGGADSLGLTVCKALVELMGGSLYQTSGLSQKPAVLFNIGLEMAPSAARKYSKGTVAQLKNSTLLLAVPDEMSRLIITRYAHDWGIAVMQADTPDDLLNRIIGAEEPRLAIIQKHFIEMEALQNISDQACPLIELTLDRQSISSTSLRGTPFKARIHTPIIMKLLRGSLLAALPRRPRTA